MPFIQLMLHQLSVSVKPSQAGPGGRTVHFVSAEQTAHTRPSVLTEAPDPGDGQRDGGN